MPHYTQCISSGEGRNYISGAKIRLLFELIKEKLNKKQNDDDLINENDNDNENDNENDNDNENGYLTKTVLNENDNENNTRCVGCE